MSYITTEFSPALKVTDTGTSRVVTSSGTIDKTYYEYVNIKTNKAALTTNVRELELECTNGYSSDTDVWVRITAKGSGGLIIPSPTAKPTWAAYMEGAIIYDNTANTFYGATNAAWVALH